jgi:hypothetical protein
MKAWAWVWEKATVTEVAARALELAQGRDSVVA